MAQNKLNSLLKPAKTLIKKGVLSYFQRRFQSNTLQMLFVIGHMRSGSSLLVHILNTNPAIIGYGETHSSYQNEKDFGKVAFKIYRSFKILPSNETYILDKILHSYTIKNTGLLKNGKIIFLLRNPSQTMPSIHKLDPKRFTPSATFEYYIERMERIIAIARELDPNKWICITYDRLVNRQDTTFQQIEDLLDLKKKLTEKYDTTWATGKRGIGDSSKYIYEGKIVNKNQQKTLTPIFKPFIKEAEHKYFECLKALGEINRF